MNQIVIGKRWNSPSLASIIEAMMRDTSRLLRAERRQVLDDRNEFGGIDRLGDVKLKAGAQGAGAVFAPRQRSQRNRGDGTSARKCPKAGDELVAIMAGHADVT